MTSHVTPLRDAILLAALPKVATQGWSWALIEQASQEVDSQDHLEKSIFPHGVSDVVAHFSDYVDREMLKALDKIPTTSLRTKDKIRIAAVTRYDILEKYKDVVQASMGFWALPNHAMQGQRVLWRTADRIWAWAGDKATDYNRQTKRALLSSVLLGATMVWLKDDSEKNVITHAFLDRRLENIVEFGKVIGTMKNIVPNLFRQANRYR